MLWGASLGRLEMRNEGGATHLRAAFPYGAETELAPGRREVVAPRAFADRIEAGEDIHLLAGHDYEKPLTAPEGTAEFDRQYWEVMTGKTQEAKRSWAAAIKLLRNSDRWAAKSVRYRQDLDPVLAYLEEKIGKRDVARLVQADIYDAMDKNKHRVRFANYIPVAISMIAKELVRCRWLTDNPAKGIERLSVPKDRQQPHVPWPDAAVGKFRAEAGSPNL